MVDYRIVEVDDQYQALVVGSIPEAESPIWRVRPSQVLEVEPTNDGGFRVLLVVRAGRKPRYLYLLRPDLSLQRMGRYRGKKVERIECYDIDDMRYPAPRRVGVHQNPSSEDPCKGQCERKVQRTRSRHIALFPEQKSL